ncbi:chemotaxis response regulator protein-glutamate methylesterase [Rhizobium sp. CG4]|jgi:two-component system chemotaxis response regulator CheB|uniref:protein-glutamate O-methylesterase CheB n=1 Tax=Rhizobium/Agrobacterium group TaxID=227290 RepID=UPI001783DBA1|nr:MULTISPECIES: protein-glutamate O-methylesterase CheB [Rhizobium/Agrobacterium group]MBD9385812.1 chemotaxis response regulator protein-glutamate methylesterase [Agrobacterium sp. AGB01]MCM2456022.1 chemotaxis response regulator protein-glutamate methylesterase [Rhizobium sp. CG4]MCS4243680.1 two-component system chemotaxis response regulator CheB [Rhizobium sp. BIGb0125]MDO5894318.1 protein-glutamate O-methylesterase CheB [Agrobacterium sp. Azo12]
MGAPARVLVVDDSPTMRGLITAVLKADPDVQVVGQAGDAMEARAAIKQLNPDVVTLDIEMPDMNGLEFLEKIMRLRPMPVIMVSTLTHHGANASLTALEIGAFDCVGKPAPGDRNPFGDLAEKVKAAARSQLVSYRTAPAPVAERPAPPKAMSVNDYRGGRKIVAIGSSTGGVEALITVLQKFPANCPPTVITQHMPPTFTKSFAERLNRLCAPVVEEATDGARLQIGKIYLAPGGERHLQVVNHSAPSCRLLEREPVNGHRPSVDVLFDSVAELAGRNAVGVILTGMGRDGAAGLLKMRHAGARTVGQNEKTCVVYGMPRVAYELGAVEQQLPLTAIGEEILKLTAARKEGSE